MWLNFEGKVPQEQDKILEELRNKLAQTGVGVTLRGNVLTIRWNQNDHLVDVQAIITDVSTPKETQEYRNRLDRMAKLSEKYAKKGFDLEGDLFWADEGEHLK